MDTEEIKFMSFIKEILGTYDRWHGKEKLPNITINPDNFIRVSEDFDYRNTMSFIIPNRRGYSIKVWGTMVDDNSYEIVKFTMYCRCTNKSQGNICGCINDLCKSFELAVPTLDSSSNPNHLLELAKDELTKCYNASVNIYIDTKIKSEHYDYFKHTITTENYIVDCMLDSNMQSIVIVGAKGKPSQSKPINLFDLIKTNLWVYFVMNL